MPYLTIIYYDLEHSEDVESESGDDDCDDDEEEEEDDHHCPMNSTLHLQGPEEIQKVLSVLGISTSISWNNESTLQTIENDEKIEHEEVIEDINISGHDEWLEKSLKR